MSHFSKNKRCILESYCSVISTKLGAPFETLQFILDYAPIENVDIYRFLIVFFEEMELNDVMEKCSN